MPWISIPQFAKLQGVTKRYIYDLIERGKIPAKALKIKKPGGKQKVIHKGLASEGMAASVTSRKDTKTKSKQSTLPEDQKEIIEKSGVPQHDKLVDAQKEKETYLAALKKLEYEQKNGELILAEDVKHDAARAARIVKGAVSSWPGRTAPLLAPVSDVFEVEQILKRECDQLLNEIADEFIS